MDLKLRILEQPKGCDAQTLSAFYKDLSAANKHALLLQLMEDYHVDEETKEIVLKCKPHIVKQTFSVLYDKLSSENRYNYTCDLCCLQGWRNKPFRGRRNKMNAIKVEDDDSAVLKVLRFDVCEGCYDKHLCDDCLKDNWSINYYGNLVCDDCKDW